MEELLEKRKTEKEPEIDVENEEEPEEIVAKEMIQFVDEDGNKYEVPKTASTVLKLDGEEVVTPVSTMTRRYQKGAAGARRMEESNLLKQELLEKEKELAEREAALNKPVVPNIDNKDKIKKLVAAVVEADEEKAVELFSDVYQKPVDIDESAIEKVVDKKVESRIKKREQKDFNMKVIEANEKFETKFPELVEDPMLYDMVDRETAKISQSSPGRDPWKVISEAAKSVKAWKEGLTVKPTPKKKSTPTPLSGRSKLGEDKKPPSRQE